MSKSCSFFFNQVRNVFCLTRATWHRLLSIRAHNVPFAFTMSNFNLCARLYCQIPNQNPAQKYFFFMKRMRWCASRGLQKGSCGPR